MLTFGNPSYLYLLLLLPLMVLVHLLLVVWKTRTLKRLGKASIINQLMPEKSAKREYTKFTLLIVALSTLIVAMARPQLGTKTTEVEAEGIEIVIAMDVSNSMLAQDITPSRLSRAKQLLGRIIDARYGDKIALVLFAGSSFIQMPLTNDAQATRLFLNTISTESIAQQGTNIREALEKSLQAFSSDTDIDKAIILLSDCENHQDDLNTVINEIEQKNIKLCVIGIGTEEGANIPLPGSRNALLTDQDGKIVTTRFSSQAAKKIAEDSNGFFIHATNTTRELQALQRELQTLRTKKAQTVKYTEYDDKFPLFAWVTLVILIAQVCIFDKKNRIFRNINIFGSKNT